MNEHSPQIGHSLAADRMRLHRERQRIGLRCIMIQLRETEIDVLVRKGLLNRGRRDDRSAIVKALHTHLDRTLGRTLIEFKGIQNWREEQAAPELAPAGPGAINKALCERVSVRSFTVMNPTGGAQEATTR
jgi:hypothetical protein